MNKTAKFLIVVALIAAICGIIIYKHYKNVDSSPSNTQTGINIINNQQTNKAELQGSKALPRLIDLGADKCIPCKMMAPILEELKKKYAEVFNVEFIDVWKNPDAAEQYNIRVIPTQIFFDASGKELFRHEGFFSKQDILAKWKEHGVVLTETQ